MIPEDSLSKPFLLTRSMASIRGRLHVFEQENIMQETDVSSESVVMNVSIRTIFKSGLDYQSPEIAH